MPLSISGDGMFQIPKQPLGLFPGYIVYPTPGGVMPRNWYDSLKISARPKCRTGTAATFPPGVCGHFQSCTSAQTNTTLYIILTLIPILLEGSGSAGAVARLFTVLAVWQSLVTTVMTPLAECSRSVMGFTNFQRPPNLSPRDVVYHTPGV